jgi:hypothetical protein
MDELAAQLRDHEQLQTVRERVWQQRHLFTFDHHVPELISFFRSVIGVASTKPVRAQSLTMKKRKQSAGTNPRLDYPA